MKTIYVYPGTFSPPTFGHQAVACQAAAIFPKVIVLCSENPEKEKVWFTPEECKELWKTYDLPDNVEIMTLSEFKALQIRKSALVLIRGIRNADDLEQEKRVMLLNKNKFGIKKFFYIFGPEKNKKISSSKVRQDAKNLNIRSLSRQVSPLVISALLEKTLKLKNIFMVVGPTASGKSTLLQMFEEIDANNHWINTDTYSKTLRPWLVKKFGNEDLIKLAINDDEKIKKVIAKPWLKLLVDSLKKLPEGSNAFIEIPYGLRSDKSMFRFVGGKVLYVGCTEKERNLERVIARGTPQLAAFINLIPNRQDSAEIAEKNKLSISYVNTDCSLEKLREKAKTINELINGGIKNAYDL